MIPRLYDWQDQENKTHGSEPRRAIFASPRVGKSLAAVVGLDTFLPDGGRAIVVAPKTVCPQWTELLADAGFETIRGYGSSATIVAARLRAWKGSGRAVLVLSDSLLHRLADAVLKWLGEGGALIVDESHRFAGVSTKRGRAMRRLAKRASWVRLLSGTPAPNHAGNLWGQMVALNPEEWGGGSYERFATEFLVRDAMFPSEVLAVRKPDELRRLLLKSASIIRREDVFGPDSWQTITRTLDLPPTVRKQYDTLAKQWVLEDPGITADNVAVRLLRLQQITSGSLPDGKEQRHLHSVKIDAVLADLEDIVNEGEKAVVFYRFVEEGHRMEAAAAKAYPEAVVLRLGGDSSEDEREAVFTAIASEPGAVIAVVQLQAGGVGRSMAEAGYAMFLSEDFSFAGHEQARDRVYKPGARRVAISYRCRQTVDEFIGRALDSKRSVHEAIRNADLIEMTFGKNKNAKA